ncbi:MAG TPA: hypothetical protein VN377_02625, partial [Candidatus Thermoplasmatota archaeon]|nr:hypothetical protein [Candidatus Thermoplasmatota archaeon]
MWRGFSVVCLCIILLPSTVSAVITPHENFDAATEDLIAIVSFFDDAKMLCEEALRFSLKGNCTIQFGEPLTIQCAQEPLLLSVQKGDELTQKLLYSTDSIGKLQNEAGSYQYLKDFLLPLKELGSNVSLFVTVHRDLTNNLSKVVDGVVNRTNAMYTLYCLVYAQSLVQSLSGTLQDIETNLGAFKEGFSVDTLRGLVADAQQMVILYEGYITTLLTMVESEKPYLSVYVDDTTVYLGEDVSLYGVFLAQRRFIVNQSIDVLWDGQKINMTVTRAAGVFKSSIPVSLTTVPKAHTIMVSTVYNHSAIFSRNVTITVLRIQTRVTLVVPKTHYYLNESILFSGRLVDYKDRGFSAPIILQFAGENVSLRSDGQGNFSYLCTRTLAFGRYGASAAFTPETIYLACVSEKTELSIDTPTVLTFAVAKTNLTIGDALQCTGRLTSMVDGSALENKTINVFINTNKIGFAMTDTNGYYRFTSGTQALKQNDIYQMYAMFDTTDAQWRSATSEKITVRIIPIQNAEGIPVLNIAVAIIVALSVSLVLFLLRKKQAPAPTKKGNLTNPTLPIPLIQEVTKTCMDLQEFFADSSTKGKDAFKTAVI